MNEPRWLDPFWALLFPRAYGPRPGRSFRRRPRPLYWSLAGLLRGLHVMARSRAGKTAYLISLICWFLQQKIACVVFDDTGQVGRGLAAALLARPELRADGALERVRFVQFGGPADYAFTLPAFNAWEHPEMQARRLVRRIVDLDEHLRVAPIHGAAAVETVGLNFAALACAMRDQLGYPWQLTDIPRLMEDNALRAWVGVQVEPVVPEAVRWVRGQWDRWSRDERHAKSFSFLARIQNLTRDPALRPVIAGSVPSFTEEDLFTQGLCAVYMFDQVQTRAASEDLALNRYDALLEAIRRRGPGRHHPMVVLMIDELSALLQHPSMKLDLMDLAARWAAYKLVPIVAHQAPWQVADPQAMAALWGLGNQLIGPSDDYRSAYETMEQLYRINPFRLRWINSLETMSREEQLALAAQEWMQMRGRFWLVRRYLSTYEPDPYLYRVPYPPFIDTSQVDDLAVALLLWDNRRRFGRDVQTVLREIDQRPQRLRLPGGRPKK